MYIEKLNRIIIVTGAGKGIGNSIALAFLQNGDEVILVDIDPVLGENAAIQFKHQGYRAQFLKADVANVVEIEQTINTVVAKHGRIDVLINNAGISEFCDPLEMEEAFWDRILDTNLKGTFFFAREAAKVMRLNNGGAIVNIASTRALMSEPNSEAYAASKGGILALTHAMAASFSKFNIRVNAILPGWIETGDYGMLKKVDHEQHFSNRVGKPEDVARACLFLSDNQNGFITGTQLVLDGGMTRKMIYED